MKHKSLLLVVLVLAVLYQFVWEQDVWNASLDKVSSMMSIIRNKYYKEVDEDELLYSSVRGMLLTLDPHSYFLDPDSFSRLREDQTGKYSGLGIQIQKQEDRLVVISPMESSPAWKLGIQAGDVISHINGESTKPISSFEAMQRLRGEKGTKVNITIVRDGLEKPIELTVVRDEIPLYSVPYAFMLTSDIGYLFIRNFGETTTDEFEEKMKILISKGMKKLVLDLRFNGGGSLFESIKLSDEFLPQGARIVSIRGRNRNYEREFRASRENQYEFLPLVVIINQGSASASEIVSGAIMDNDRGLVVGEDSFGKGLVQSIFPLASNLAVALTTAEYFTPSGRSIQRDYSSLDDYLMARGESDEEREVRYTVRGRKVLGQGGITPDIEVRMTTKTLTIELLMRGAFFSYARKFVSRQTPLSERVILPGDKRPAAEDRLVVSDKFIVDEAVLADFQDYLHRIKVDFSSQAFQEASSEIKRELERELFSAIWGAEDGQRIYRKSDPVVLKAIEIMPQAAEFVVRKP